MDKYKAPKLKIKKFKVGEAKMGKDTSAVPSGGQSYKTPKVGVKDVSAGGYGMSKEMEDTSVAMENNLSDYVKKADVSSKIKITPTRPGKTTVRKARTQDEVDSNIIDERANTNQMAKDFIKSERQKRELMIKKKIQGIK